MPPFGARPTFYSLQPARAITQVAWRPQAAVRERDHSVKRVPAEGGESEESAAAAAVEAPEDHLQLAMSSEDGSLRILNVSYRKENDDECR